jgi:hypothetical protein
MNIYVVYFILALSLLMLMYIVKNNQPVLSENTIIAYPILAEIIFWGISIKKSY